MDRDGDDGSSLEARWGSLPTYSAGCVDCPAGRVGGFREVVADGSTPCGFARGQLAARAPIPLAWVDRYAFVLVRRGVLVRVRSDATGAAVATDCAGPGCFVSLPVDNRAGELGYAATELMVCLCPRETTERIIESDPASARDLVRGMSAAIDRMERIAQSRGQASAEARVAALLVTIAETLAPPRRRDRLPSGLQQRDLARLAGLRHESFCRVLGELEKRGLVRRDPEGLEITDHDALAAVS